MAFPIPDPWNRDTADVLRDEDKRVRSPGSFFYSQGRNHVLAANYFHDDRLVATARGGVALKHRHRIHLALFGQLMASFEFFLKDFVATAVDSSSLLDSRILKEKWLETDTSRLLANRSGTATLGSMLVHSTLGWHSPSQVNERYAKLFQFQPFETSEIETLDKLWVLRHSVAHNAGMIIHYDATRIGNEGLAEHAADIDAEFISQTFDFLSSLAKKICEEGGDKLLRMYFTPLVARGANYQTDKTIYQNLWYLSAYLESRAQDLPVLKAEDYASDFEEYSAPVG